MHNSSITTHINYDQNSLSNPSYEQSIKRRTLLTIIQSYNIITILIIPKQYNITSNDFHQLGFQQETSKTQLNIKLMQGTYLVALGIRINERLHFQLHKKSPKSRTLILVRSHGAKRSLGAG